MLRTSYFIFFSLFSKVISNGPGDATALNCGDTAIFLDYDTTSNWFFGSSCYPPGNCTWNFTFNKNTVVHFTLSGNFSESFFLVKTSTGTYTSLNSTGNWQFYAFYPKAQLFISLKSSTSKSICLNYITAYTAQSLFTVVTSNVLSLNQGPTLRYIQDLPYHTSTYESANKKPMKLYVVAPRGDPIWGCLSHSYFIFNSTDPSAIPISDMSALLHGPITGSKLIFFQPALCVQSFAYYLFTDANKTFTKREYLFSSGNNGTKEITLDASGGPTALTVFSGQSERGFNYFPCYLLGAEFFDNATLSVYPGVLDYPRKSFKPLATYTYLNRIVAPEFFGGKVRTFFADQGTVIFNITDRFQVTPIPHNWALSGVFNNNNRSIMDEPDEKHLNYVEIFAINKVENRTAYDNSNESGEEIWWNGSPQDLALQEAMKTGDYRHIPPNMEFKPSNGTLNITTNKIFFYLGPWDGVQYTITPFVDSKENLFVVGSNVFIYLLIAY